jgi:hypothetical protein
MKTRIHLDQVALRTMCKIGYFLLAAVTLVPLSPVIGLMYFAEWMHVDSAKKQFMTVYGKANRPVRCLRSACPSRIERYDTTTTPFAHPAANRYPASDLAP